MNRMTPKLCLFHAAIAFTHASARVRPSTTDMLSAAELELIAAARRWLAGDKACERCELLPKH
jgi:hypothetical protein